MLDWKQTIRERLPLLELSAKREAEIVEELAQDLERRYQEARAEGSSAEEARAHALEQISNSEELRKRLLRVERKIPQVVLTKWNDLEGEMRKSESRKVSLLADLLQDIRYGFRMLRKNPGFTTVAVLTLALGIGANTAMFSIVNGVLLRPLPYPEPEELVQITTMWRSYGEGDISEPEYFDLLNRSQSFEALGMYDSPRIQGRGIDLTEGSGGPERIAAIRITPSGLTAVNVSPLLGRPFLPEEGTPAGERAVLLNYALWQSRFGGDTAAVGSSLTIGGKSYRIIGVMPKGFAYPNKAVQIWLPYQIDRKNHDDRGSHYNFIIARLKQGVTVEQAQAELKNISWDLLAELGGWYKENEFRFLLRPYAEVVTGDVRPVLLLLLGAVGLVLLIACANVANLLLARITGREKEIAVRAALGAGGWRIGRQLLTESLLLSTLGGVGALALAALAFRALLALQPDNLPRLDEIQIDTTVLGFNALLVFVTGVAFGLVPVRKVFSLDLQTKLKEGSRDRTGPGSHRTRSLLVVTEIALATVLLVGSALLLQSLYRILTVDLGFRTENVLTTRISLDALRYPEAGQRVQFYRTLMEELRARPEVTSAGGITLLPLSGFVNDRAIRPEGPQLGPGESLQTQYRLVTPDYFLTLGIPVLQGRTFTNGDGIGSEGVTILSESVARKFWGNENPLGRRITLNGSDWLTVVGVVGDVRHSGVTQEEPPIFYRSIYQVPWSMMSVVVCTRSDPAALINLVRNVVLSLDPLQPAYDIKVMNQMFSNSFAQDRFNTVLFSTFGALALGLAVIGIYGVINYSVSQRTHEFGIRMALGAQTRDVLGMILKQGGALVLLGVGIGLAASAALTRYLESLLFGVSATDPETFVGVSVLLALVSLLACYVPARQATKVDPIVALRYE